MAKEIKIRDMEELKELSVKSMTGHEAKALVTQLREDLVLAQNQINAYKDNIEATRQQEAETIKKAEAMERFYRARLDYVMQAANNLHDSVRLATKGEIA